jgi:hypothetical protein
MPPAGKRLPPLRCGGKLRRAALRQSAKRLVQVAVRPHDNKYVTMRDVRRIITFLISITLLGCSDNSTSRALQVQNDSLTTAPVNFDSTIVIKKGGLINDSIISEIEKVTSWRLQEGYLTIDTLANINATTSYVIYEISTGVCLTKYIMTFIDNKTKDYEVLEQGCDGDLGSPRNEYSEQRSSLSKNKFKKVLFVETPVDKNTIDKKGDFKQGYSQDNVQMQTDSTTIEFSINSDATIKRDTFKLSR